MIDDFDAQLQSEDVYPWCSMPLGYTLILTAGERGAFDWVGDRYSSGDVARLLYPLVPEGQEWADPGDITFVIPEHVAWEIRDLAERDDYLWPCFGLELVDKLQDFIGRIV